MILLVSFLCQHEARNILSNQSSEKNNFLESIRSFKSNGNINIMEKKSKNNVCARKHTNEEKKLVKDLKKLLFIGYDDYIVNKQQCKATSNNNADLKGKDRTI